ncbi:hypothetical protein BGZ93_006123 [Podila epicladia]|nr:hypothetical protein BGZ92_008504 [Podila epicladia]KAG0099754.1 hypothetical protein BGZ93_006123 [Podila epicladia]
MPITQTVNQGLHGAANLGQGAINKGTGFFHEFRDFLTKGNAFDLAVAFIISTALTAVIKSFVDDLITPLIGLASNRNLDEMFLILRCGQQGDGCSYPTRAIAQADGAVTWNWGRFINTVIYLVLVGLFLFAVVKIYYALRRKAIIRDKACPYCGKDVNGAAVRCAFCTSWFDQDARRKLDGDFSMGSAMNMSTTTFGSSNGLLKEKESIDVVRDDRNAGVQRSMMNIQPQAIMNAQPGNVTISGLGDGEVDNVDHPRGVNPNGKATSGSR